MKDPEASRVPSLVDGGAIHLLELVVAEPQVLDYAEWAFPVWHQFFLLGFLNHLS